MIYDNTGFRRSSRDFLIRDLSQVFLVISRRFAEPIVTAVAGATAPRDSCWSCAKRYCANRRSPRAAAATLLDQNTEWIRTGNKGAMRRTFAALPVSKPARAWGQVFAGNGLRQVAQGGSELRLFGAAQTKIRCWQYDLKPCGRLSPPWCRGLRCKRGYQSGADAYRRQDPEGGPQLRRIAVVGGKQRNRGTAHGLHQSQAVVLDLQ